ncbi:ubiquitin specific protease 14 isoform X2 [Rhodnius prolixus]|uniref:ubiquitin specific protease 14 isoform X2 n=1 Tax=Rhodnius prolixus TaxID=13249 RepID=UPI003D18DED0
MPVYSVKVKWGRETFSDVELNTDEEPMVFKAQIYALTGVIPQRQKVMIKGCVIKDDSWGAVNIAENLTILLMGCKEEDLPREPSVKPLFLEDMNVAEIASVSNTPAGLANLGNTCYMNATVQCLKTVTELRDCLKSFKGAQSVTAALRDLYELMDKGFSVPPIMLLQFLQMAFPRFADKNENGTFVQQDANECWTEIVRMLQQKLPSLTTEGFVSKHRFFIDQYFGGVFEVELKCDESEEEPVTKSEESFLQLSCFISQEVKYMNTGLKSKLQEKITKNSQCLNRDAIFTKTSKIKRLPAYLTVQFVRFYYKEKESINAKILKEVKFPMEFDAYDLCTPELQAQLMPMRDRFKDEEERRLKVATQLKDSALSSRNDNVEPSKTSYISEPFSFKSDLGSNNSGYYRLQAVLTHRGRSSSSGHYVAWIRQNETCWIKCDDDVISPVSSEDVLKLCGGGDWHCAYVLLYGPKVLEIPDPLNNQLSNKLWNE